MIVLVQGARGQEVANLQLALNLHLPKELPPLNIDRIFGPKTLARVKTFQSANKLKVDGIVGPKTHQALYTFLDLPHHVVFDHRPAGEAVRRRFSVGDGPPSVLPPMPILPPLRFPYPRPFLAPPPIVPRLELQLLLFARSVKFSVEGGGQTKLVTTLGPGDPEPRRQVHLFNDVKATVWSKPLGDNVTLTAGGGVIQELRLKPRGDKIETSAYVIAGVEVKDVLKIGAVDLAKLEAEAQVKPESGIRDFTATVTVGPEVEVANGTTIRLGAFAEIATDGVQYQISSGVKLSGTVEFDLRNFF